MRISITDGGARGQGIGSRLASEGHEVFISPGSPGNEAFAHSTGIAIDNIGGQVEFSQRNGIDLSMATEDLPLAMGAGDAFADAGLAFFGPNQAQARIEWDRDWAKREFRDVPMGAYGAFSDPEEAINYAASRQWPLYLKQNDLARGKGATRCENLEEFTEALDSLHGNGLITEENPAVIEDYVVGREVSHHAFCDGLDHISIPFVLEDHKTIGEGDTGAMTGGMGAVGPVPEHSVADVIAMGDIFVAPVVRSLGFKGLLFAGLKSGKALEWNARPGSPELQLYLRFMKTPLAPVLMACVKGELAKMSSPPEWDLKKYGVNLVLAAQGYPGEPRRGDVIEGIADAEKLGVQVLHGGTRQEGTNVVTNGGRVLDLVYLANNKEAALQMVYRAASLIGFGGEPAVYRKDIGRRPY